MFVAASSESSNCSLSCRWQGRSEVNLLCSERIGTKIRNFPTVKQKKKVLKICEFASWTLDIVNLPILIDGWGGGYGPDWRPDAFKSYLHHRHNFSPVDLITRLIVFCPAIISQMKEAFQRRKNTKKSYKKEQHDVFVFTVSNINPSQLINLKTHN